MSGLFYQKTGSPHTSSRMPSSPSQLTSCCKWAGAQAGGMFQNPAGRKKDPTCWLPSQEWPGHGRCCILQAGPGTMAKGHQHPGERYHQQVVWPGREVKNWFPSHYTPVLFYETEKWLQCSEYSDLNLNFFNLHQLHGYNKIKKIEKWFPLHKNNVFLPYLLTIWQSLNSNKYWKLRSGWKLPIRDWVYVQGKGPDPSPQSCGSGFVSVWIRVHRVVDPDSWSGIVAPDPDPVKYKKIKPLLYV